jgi:glycosyltransferase involved in cell wall biosynthesis
VSGLGVATATAESAEVEARSARPALSVVIGAHNAAHVIEECLAALELQEGRSEAEVIVADCSTDGTAGIVLRRFPSVQVVPVAMSLAVPALRARGIAKARGSIIAIIDPFTIVNPGWMHAVRRAHAQRRHPAIGGAVDLHEACRTLTDWAIYINEYGMFMSPVTAGETWILPGSNISYKRAALFDGERPRHHEFWKTFANWDLEAGGPALWLEPTMTVRLRKPLTFADYFSTRPLHGRCFGGMRSAGRPWLERLFRAATCPLVPFVLLSRWGRVYLAKGHDRSKLLWTLPQQLLFFGAWAAGECWGYLRGPGRSCSRLYY